MLGCISYSPLGGGEQWVPTWRECVWVLGLANWCVTQARSNRFSCVKFKNFHRSSTFFANMWHKAGNKSKCVCECQLNESVQFDLLHNFEEKKHNCQCDTNSERGISESETFTPPKSRKTQGVHPGPCSCSFRALCACSVELSLVSGQRPRGFIVILRVK